MWNFLSRTLPLAYNCWHCRMISLSSLPLLHSMWPKYVTVYDTTKLQLSMFDPTSTKIDFMVESLQLMAYLNGYSHKRHLFFNHNSQAWRFWAYAFRFDGWYCQNGAKSIWLNCICLCVALQYLAQSDDGVRQATVEIFTEEVFSFVNYLYSRTRLPSAP